MIELCDLCGKTHEVETAVFGGIPHKTCPEVPEDTFVPMQKRTTVIYKANGDCWD